MSLESVIAGLQAKPDLPTPQEFVRGQQAGAVDRTVAKALREGAPSPEEAAKHYGIAKREGLSVEEARRQAEQLRITGVLQGFSSEALTKRYPETANVFADPKLASIGWDDLETIKLMEQAHLDLKSAPERYLLSMQRSASTSFEQNQISLLNAEEMMRAFGGLGPLPDSTAEIKRLEDAQRMKLDYGLEGPVGTVVEGANIALEGMLGSMVDVFAGKGAGGAAGAVIGGVASVRGGPGAMVRGAARGARAGSKLGGYLGASVPMMGSLWGELKTTAPDLDPKGRALISAVGGGVAGTLEYAGLESIGNGLKQAARSKGVQRIAGIASASLGEALTEGGQAIVEAGAVLTALGLSDPSAAFLDPKGIQKRIESFQHVSRDGERFTGYEAIMVRVLESMAQGAIGGGYASGVGAGVVSAADVAVPMVKAKAAQTTQLALEQVVKVAGKSKIAQRNPEAFRDATAKMMPDTQIHISAEGVRRFFQEGDDEGGGGPSGGEDDSSHSRVPGFHEKAAEASLTGADMVISYADWIAYVAPTRFGRATMKDIRVSDPRAMTANEADAWEKEQFGGIRGVQDLAAAAKKASDVEQLAREELTTQIGRKGGSEEQIAAEVDLQMGRILTRAKRKGWSLRKLIKEEGLFTTSVEGQSINMGPSLEKKIRRLELQKAVKDLREKRDPESRMKKNPMLTLLVRHGGVEPGSNLGRAIEGAVPASGKGSTPGLFRRGGMTEADQLPAYESDLLIEQPALLDESGYLTNDQIREIVDDEMRGKPLRTMAEQHAIHEERQAKRETEKAIADSGIANPDKMTIEELADALLAAEQTVSSDTGPAMETITHESAGVKKKGPPRGAIDVTPDLRGVVIRFFKAADGSTMLHEGGHLWLEQLRKDALEDDAPAQLKQDWQIIKDWLGIRRGDRISERNSERFARAVEQYLMEGKSPSTRLEGPFERYAVWLTRIYKTLRNKYFRDVRLTDPVRQVLDRMLATDAEIFQAQQNRGLRGEVLSTEDGLTPQEVEQLRTAAEEGRHEAEMENVRIQVKRQRRRALKLWKENEAKVRAEVTSAVDSRPDVQVSQWIRYGKAREGMEFPPAARQVIQPQKFSREGLVAVAGSPAVLKVLSAGKYGYYSKEGGYDPAFVADIFGYASPSQMLSDLSDLQNAGGREAIIDRMTEATMEKRFGKFDESAELHDLVVEAAANEKAIRSLELEDRALSGRTGRKRLAREVAARIAKRTIGQMTLGDILPRKGQVRASERYRAAAEREAREALKAHANGDLRNMQLHRQRQLVNLAIEKEARRVEILTARTVARIGKIANKHSQVILGKVGEETTAWKDQMAKLLVRFGFPSAIKNPKPQSTLADFALTWTAKGANFRISPDIFNENFAGDYTQLTVDKFIDVAQAIESIMGSARALLEAKVGADAAALETDIDDLVDEANAGPKVPDYKSPKTPAEYLYNRAKGLMASLKQMEHLIDRIGPAARRILWKPFADAEAESWQLTQKIVEPITQAYKQLIQSDPVRYHVRRSIKALRTVTNPEGLYSQSDLLMMLGNMMNASNAEKMSKGFGLSEAQIWNVLEAEISKEDRAFVEMAVEHLEKLWPLAVAQELRLTGLSPQAIQPRPHTWADGHVTKGGYFPVIYDTEAIEGLGQKLDATVRSETHLFSVLSGLQRVITGHTHMVERADLANAPMNLDINGLPDHLLAVIHDLTHREPLLRAYKIVNDPRAIKALNARVGLTERKLFGTWLEDIAQYRNRESASTAEWYRLARGVRARMLIMQLGARISTLGLQPFGNAAGYVIGKKSIGDTWGSYHRAALYRMVTQPGKEADFARATSAMMRRRTSTYDRDYADLLESSYGATGKLRRLGEASIGLLAKVQFYSVDVPIWNAAYHGARLEKGMSHEDAADLADSVVEKSQGSGSIKNRSAFMRDRGLLSQITMYYTYHNTIFNVLHEEHLAGKKGTELATTYFLAIVVPAIAAFWERQALQQIEQLIGIEDPDEEDSKLVGMMLAIPSEAMGLAPVLRDAASFWTNLQGDGRMFDPATPIELVTEWTVGVAYEGYKAAKAIADDKSPRNPLVRMVGDMVRVAALAFGAPAGYVTSLAERMAKE